MKVAAGNVEKFLRQPDQKFSIILIHGPDAGLVRERADALTAAMGFDAADDYSVVRLTAGDLKADPARLNDEISTRPMFADDKLVRLGIGNEDVSKTLADLLESNAGDVKLLVEAGDLKPWAPVRKSLEAHAAAAVIACYEDGSNALARLINEVLTGQGKRITSEARGYLVRNLGRDRAISRNELDKLVIFMGDEDEIDLSQAAEVVGDNGALSVERIVMAAANGDHFRLSRQLDRAGDEGVTGIAVLRSAIRHFERLQLAHGHMSGGLSAGQALKKLRPTVMYLFEKEMSAQLSRWSETAISRALTTLLSAEAQCKSTGYVDIVIAGQALHQFAVYAGNRSRRRTQ